MLVTITGILVSSTALSAVIEVNGLGYELQIPVTTAEKLPSPGAKVRLHTHVVYREDAQLLFGFATPEDREFFRLLIDNVTGVGPKMALSIMSKLSVNALSSAIRMGEIAMLSKCPGIGKKTAERLVVELKGKLGGSGDTQFTDSGQTDSPGGDTRMRDAVSALVALGYKTPDADQAIRRAALALGGTAATEQLIKKALNG